MNHLQSKLPIFVALVGGIFHLVACGGGDGNSNEDAGGGQNDAALSCPTHVEFESLGDLTRIDIGFTGLGHGGALPANTYATYRLFDCDDECRRCKLTGPVASDTTRRPTSFKRCVGDLTRACDDDDGCEGADICRWQLRAVATNSANQCTGVYFEPVSTGDGNPVQGTIDLVTGAAAFTTVNLRTTTYADGVCQNCENDNTAFDGETDGRCSSSGEVCDVSGSGGGGGSPAYITSFDCPNGALLADNPLPLPNIGSASQTWTLDSSRPNCTGAGAEATDCWCGVCEDFTPCFQDSQCSSGTCGYAGTVEAPISSYNNVCDTTCDYDEASAIGSCVSTALGGMTVPCFPRSGSITVEGGVEVGNGFFITTLAGLNCFPATGTPTDQILGLPGILYVSNVYRIVPLTLP